MQVQVSLHVRTKTLILITAYHEMCTGAGAKSEDLSRQFRFDRHLQGTMTAPSSAARNSDVEILVFFFRVMQFRNRVLRVLHSLDLCLLVLCMVTNLYETTLGSGCLVCNFSGRES